MPWQSWATQYLGLTSRFHHCPGMRYLPMLTHSIAGHPENTSLHRMHWHPQFLYFHFPWKCFNCQHVSHFWQFVHCLYKMIQKRVWFAGPEKINALAASQGICPKQALLDSSPCSFYRVFSGSFQVQGHTVFISCFLWQEA